MMEASANKANQPEGRMSDNPKYDDSTHFSGLRMSASIRETADSIREKIANTDITRINGYLRLANLTGAGLLEVACVIAIFSARSYSEFIVYVYLMILAGGLVFIENHDSFPKFAEKVKVNFGFMFTAPGRAGYILFIVLLAFTLGWVGTLIGVFFLALGSFNFFLIYRHPAYQAHMTQAESSMESSDSMPQVQYASNSSSPSKVSHIAV